MAQQPDPAPQPRPAGRAGRTLRPEGNGGLHRRRCGRGRRGDPDQGGLRGRLVLQLDHLLRRGHQQPGRVLAHGRRTEQRSRTPPRHRQVAQPTAADRLRRPRHGTDGPDRTEGSSRTDSAGSDGPGPGLSSPPPVVQQTTGQGDFTGSQSPPPYVSQDAPPPYLSADPPPYTPGPLPVTAAENALWQQVHQGPAEVREQALRDLAALRGSQPPGPAETGVRDGVHERLSQAPEVRVVPGGNSPAGQVDTDEVRRALESFGTPVTVDAPIVRGDAPVTADGPGTGTPPLTVVVSEGPPPLAASPEAAELLDGAGVDRAVVLGPPTGSDAAGQPVREAVELTLGGLRCAGGGPSAQRSRVRRDARRRREHGVPGRERAAAARRRPRGAARDGGRSAARRIDRPARDGSRSAARRIDRPARRNGRPSHLLDGLASAFPRARRPRHSRDPAGRADAADDGHTGVAGALRRHRVRSGRPRCRAFPNRVRTPRHRPVLGEGGVRRAGAHHR